MCISFTKQLCHPVTLNYIAHPFLLCTCTLHLSHNSNELISYVGEMLQIVLQH